MPIVSIGSGQTGDTPDKRHAPASEIVGKWLDLGGVGIDTAWIYKDQVEIADTIKQHGADRKDLFITTKVLECIAGAEWFIEDDLKQLNTTYIDLLMIHLPYGSSWGVCAHTWTMMESYIERGILRSIGVSKFDKHELAGILKYAKVKPAVNQIMYNVYHHDDETIQFCRDNNITVEAYSPLGSWNGAYHGDVFKDSHITAIATSHNVSNAQVALKWIVQRGDVFTFMSNNEAHQVNDADVFNPNFQLSDADMNILSHLAISPALLV